MTDQTVAIVTGAARGIGLAISRVLAQEGHHVIGLDILAPEQPVDGVDFRQGDVGDQETWSALVRDHKLDRRRVRVLVNNAYLLIAKPIHELSTQEWAAQMRVNLDAIHLSMKALVPLMAPGAAVVNVSSVHALIGVAGYPAYAAAKGASVSLSRQMAIEYGPRIRVNAVLPGPIATAAWDRISDSARHRTEQGTAMGRLGAPEEVAAVVAFLCSDAASYVTGTSVLVDGGYTAVKSED